MLSSGVLSGRLTPARCILNRYYSEGIPLPPSKNWSIAGIPSPRSLIPSEPHSPRLPRTRPRQQRKAAPEAWLAHHQQVKKKFPNGWDPPRKLSRPAMDQVRELHHMDPTTASVAVLADRFRVSPDAIRRILRSKWQPSREETIELVHKENERRQARWQEGMAAEAESLTQVEKQQGKKYRWGSDELQFTERPPSRRSQRRRYP